MHDSILIGSAVAVAGLAYRGISAYVAGKHERVIAAYDKAEKFLVGKAEAHEAEAARLKALVGK